MKKTALPSLKPGMGLQKVFDRVSIHLLTQRQMSLDGNGVCVYRGQNGMKCAIGCLIPDSVFNKSYEGSQILTLWLDHSNSKMVKYLQSLINKKDTVEDIKMFYDRLQEIHDLYTVANWKFHLQRFANDYKLSAKVLNRFK